MQGIDSLELAVISGVFSSLSPSVTAGRPLFLIVNVFRNE